MLQKILKRIKKTEWYRKDFLKSHPQAASEEVIPWCCAAGCGAG